MSDFDLIVRSREDLGIRDGTIVAVGKNLAGSSADEIDAGNLAIFPGAIDAHVHFNEPGRTEWEGFATGSRAAAAGGTTTVFDMPLNAHPPTIDGESFDQKRRAAEASSIVDFALWGGLVPGNAHHFQALRDRGIVGLKAFMSNSGIDDFPCVDETVLREGMKRAAQLGMLVAVHAESEAMTGDLARRSIAAGKTTVRDYLDSRPIHAEIEAIRCAIDLAAETGCRLHIVHVSCGSGVELVARARAGGIYVTCETCPHYLVLTEEDMEHLGAVAKCAPPLRSLSERRLLRAGLGEVTTVGSDHSPAPGSMKESANFFEVWGGISGCQHLLPLVIESAPRQLVGKLIAENVAERFRLAEKGALVAGKDADLSLVDLQGGEVVRSESLHYRHRHSPYVGRKIAARVVRTILRGQTVFHDGKCSATRPGRFVRPRPLT